MMNKIEKLSRLCKDFFTTKADSLSHITGFIKRNRKITGSSFIKTLVLGNMGDANCSIESMCSLLHEDSIDITKQGLDLRFSTNAVTFMKVMYEECLRIFKSNLQLDCKILQQFNSVKLLDSSQVGLPNSMESMYKGCGASYKGRRNRAKSAVKIQVIFDYLNQTLDRLDLTEGIRSDQGYRNYLENIKSNDLLLADLGYFVPGCFDQINQIGAYFISRYKSDTNIYDAHTGAKLDLLTLLNQKIFLEKEVFLGKELKLPVRIICHKLTDEQLDTRRRKANILAKSHGYTSSQRNQRLLSWTIFITNIPSSKISAQYIWSIYRVRWQIELLFKMYKSHVRIETIKSKTNSSRILCELYAKLCVILIFHGITSCVDLEADRELSLTKALVEFKKRSRELFVILDKTLNGLLIFFKKLVVDWSIFCLKDRYRKTRISTLNRIKEIALNP